MSFSTIPRWMAAAFIAVLFAVSARAQAPVPTEAFFSAPAMRRAVVSPNGRWLATVVAPKDERARLVISDLDDKEPPKVVAMFSKLDVGNVWWVDDDWLVFDTVDMFDQSHRWDVKGGGLLAVTRGGERLRLLIKTKWESLYAATGAQALEANHFYMGNGAAGSNEIIVGQNALDNSYEFSHVIPIAVNVSTGGRRVLVDNPPPDVDGWVFDSKGKPRAAVAVKKDKWTVHWHDEAKGAWRAVGTYELYEGPGYLPRFVDENGQLFVSYLDGSGFNAIAQFDLATGKHMETPLVSTPGYNGGVGVRQSRRDGSVLALDVLTDARSRIWLKPHMQAIQAKVDAMLKGRVNLVSCGECESPSHVVVFSYSDRSPGDFLLYRPKTDQWQRLGNYKPEVDPARMARKELHRVSARDGMEIPVWITRPASGEEKALPAVVLVHGGPWSRGGEWEWEAESQFLASRGYVVIEPEFRGSHGYGYKLFRAGWKQWGQAMQDDVSDALRFAVKQGWVDAKRACIAGASYGGYATLMGLAKDPDQYRCGVAWVGVSDPLLMFEAHWSDVSRDGKLYNMPKLIGDPKADAEMLKANSPLQQAARIKAPVFLAYGGRDRRVPMDHGTRMRDALTQAGNPPEWVVYDNEGHGFFRTENQIDFWTKVEAFLAKHLK